MDATLYKKIMHNKLIEILGYYNLGINDTIFEQDNNSKHTFWKPIDCFKELSLQF